MTKAIGGLIDLNCEADDHEVSWGDEANVVIEVLGTPKNKRAEFAFCWRCAERFLKRKREASP